MKKTVAMIAMVVFLVGVGAPAFATNNSNVQSIELRDDDPKKTKKKAKTDKKECSDAKTEKSACCEKTCETSSEKKK